MILPPIRDEEAMERRMTRAEFLYANMHMNAYENAAMSYCAKLGIDPEERINYSDCSGHAVSRWCKQWEEYARILAVHHLRTHP